MMFADCARNAVRPLYNDTVRAAAHTILHLDDLEMSANCCATSSDALMRMALAGISNRAGMWWD